MERSGRHPASKTSAVHRLPVLASTAAAFLLTCGCAGVSNPAAAKVSYRTEYFKDWHPLVQTGVIDPTKDKSRKLANIGPTVKALVLPQGSYITTPNLAVFKRDKAKSAAQRANGSLREAQKLAKGAHEGPDLVVFFLANNFAHGRAILDEGMAEGTRTLRRGFQDVVEGKFDQQYRGIAEHLRKVGLAHKAVIRLGHEFNGDWNANSARANESHYAAAFRHVVDLFRNVSPRFRFDYNAAAGPLYHSDALMPMLEDAYPGDAYVDFITLDTYYSKDKPDLARHKAILTKHRDFAIKHGKPIGYPEWGFIGAKTAEQMRELDEPRWIEFMFCWLNGLPRAGPGALAYHQFFEHSSGALVGAKVVAGEVQLVPLMPKSFARFGELFTHGESPVNPPDSMGAGGRE